MIKVLEFERVQRYRYILKFLELISLVLYMYISWYIFIYILNLKKCKDMYLQLYGGRKVKGDSNYITFSKMKKTQQTKKA